jgi:hypothetical protein
VLAQRPALQSKDWQSAAALQARPAAQGVQLPPQSLSLSSPFNRPSLQVGAAQAPAAQDRERQSLPWLQFFPVPHGLQVPPQSMSVSAPFFLPSLQLLHSPSVVQDADLHAAQKNSSTAIARMGKVYIDKKIEGET